MSLFLLYRQQFLRYRPSLKIAIFGHETWNLKKCQKLHILLKGVKIGLIFTLRAAISKIRTDFKNCHTVFGHEA